MKLATLLYIRNDEGSFLLIRRLKEPNKGLLSPPGGKLDAEVPESPAQCAVREAHEECSMHTVPDDWKLLGIVTEKNFPKAGHVMIFLMEYKSTLNKLPDPCDEGDFLFANPLEIFHHPIPETDREFIWKNVLNGANTPFVISLDCTDYPDIVLI